MIQIPRSQKLDFFQKEGHTAKRRRWRVLKRTPRRPPPAQTTIRKGSCVNHSPLLSVATPLKLSTPFFHLQGCHQSMLVR